VQSGPYGNPFNTVGRQVLGSLGFDNKNETDKNNIGPRVGFAWDVKGNAKAVVRGGYGRYYDEIFQNITLYEKWSDPNTPLNFVSFSPAPFTPAQFAADRDNIRNGFVDPTFAGQSVRNTAADLQQPYADQFNAGFSGQVNKHVGFDVDYIHQIGKQEIARWRINTAQNVSDRLSPTGVFDPAHGAYITEGNRGKSVFDAVYVTGKVRSAKAEVIATYAWSKAKNCANDFLTQPADITNSTLGDCKAQPSAPVLNGVPASPDWGLTPNDVTSRATLGAVFQLPAGFQYSTALQANGGKPYSALAGLGGIRNSVRAIDPTTGQMFPRNSFRAGGYFSWDMRLSYIWKLNKSRSVEILGEVFNVTNHSNFDRDQYVTTFSSSRFGQPTQIVQGTQRQMEVGARFSF